MAWKNETGKPQSRILAIDRQHIGKYSLVLRNVQKGRFIDETNFKLYLGRTRPKPGGTNDFEVSKNPVVIGTYFEGRGKHLSPWLEMFYESTLQFEGGGVDLQKDDLELALFRILSKYVPAGGKIFVIYGEGHAATAKALQTGTPAAATPLGYILWEAGFRWFKNWYFSEGWMEGSQKLQANKPLNKEHEKRQLQVTADELKAYISENPAPTSKEQNVSVSLAARILNRTG